MELLGAVGAAVGDEASLALDHLLDLVGGVIAGGEELHNLQRRNTAASLRGEGPFAIEPVIHINDAAAVMGSNGNAAAEVRHNKARLLVAGAHFGGCAARRCLLVQGVENADTRKLGDAG